MRTKLLMEGPILAELHPAIRGMVLSSKIVDLSLQMHKTAFMGQADVGARSHEYDLLLKVIHNLSRSSGSMWHSIVLNNDVSRRVVSVVLVESPM